jgi:hypothetical protein
MLAPEQTQPWSWDGLKFDTTDYVVPPRLTAWEREKLGWLDAKLRATVPFGQTGRTTYTYEINFSSCLLLKFLLN